jgi:mono/diheme cytochrome c family protein
MNNQLSSVFDKIRKSFLLIVSTILIIAGCRFYFPTTKEQFTVLANAGAVARGKNLAFIICGGCHYDPSVHKFIGRSLNDLPKIAGKLYSANLTQSIAHGRPPQYKDAELFYLLKTGIGKNGKFMPYMMRPTMADEDVNAIIAFLRSDDEAVAPADTTVGKTHINFIGRTGIRIAVRPQPYNKGVVRPSEDDPVAHGRYLVGVIGCYHCHSGKVLGLDYSNPERSKGYMAGGIRLKDPEGKRLRGPNLTPDPETGIGKWTREDFQRAVREGMDPSGRKLSPPMPKLKELTDKQVEAIFVYLKQLPPVKHRVSNR